MSYAIDKRDTLIITELKKDARAPIRQIAKRTGIRPSTVYQRIKKLTDHNVIEHFTIKLNNKLVGENFIVFVLIKAEQELDSRIFNNEHVKEVFGVTGSYDLLLKLKFQHIHEFNDFILTLRKNKTISDTLTMVATLTLKEEL